MIEALSLCRVYECVFMSIRECVYESHRAIIFFGSVVYVRLRIIILASTSDSISLEAKCLCDSVCIQSEKNVWDSKPQTVMVRLVAQQGTSTSEITYRTRQYGDVAQDLKVFIFVTTCVKNGLCFVSLGYK